MRFICQLHVLPRLFTWPFGVSYVLCRRLISDHVMSIIIGEWHVIIAASCSYVNVCQWSILFTWGNGGRTLLCPTHRRGCQWLNKSILRKVWRGLKCRSSCGVWLFHLFIVSCLVFYSTFLVIRGLDDKQQFATVSCCWHSKAVDLSWKSLNYC